MTRPSKESSTLTLEWMKTDLALGRPVDPRDAVEAAEQVMNGMEDAETLLKELDAAEDAGTDAENELERVKKALADVVAAVRKEIGNMDWKKLSKTTLGKMRDRLTTAADKAENIAAE